MQFCKMLLGMYIFYLNVLFDKVHPESYIHLSFEAVLFLLKRKAWELLYQHAEFGTELAIVSTQMCIT